MSAVNVARGSSNSCVSVACSSSGEKAWQRATSRASAREAELGLELDVRIGLHGCLQRSDACMETHCSCCCRSVSIHLHVCHGIVAADDDLTASCDGASYELQDADGRVCSM